MEESDHRMLAKRLDLYHIEEQSPGMVYWHPRGYRLYRALEDLIRQKMSRLNYQEVQTPQLLARELWEASGHWEKFGENMFSLPLREGRELALKPMSCPCHLQIFNHKLRSWRDLPMRLAEFGQCHRDEPSGSMHGLMRTRAFEQDDAHVICRPSQIREEVRRFVALLKGVYEALGFRDIDIALSLRPERRAGSDEQWNWAEKELLAAARECDLEPRLLPGEGAFYGPKLEFALKDRMGRSWQCGTAQLDSVLPQRLGASYIDENGEKQVPLMIHHAVLGSIGRFIGILLEETAGRLPFWLSPDQVAILPISDAQHADARHLEDHLRANDIRCRMFDGAETLSRRLVSARALEIPVYAIIGKREATNKEVTFKVRDSQRTMPVKDAFSYLAEMASAEC